MNDVNREQLITAARLLRPLLGDLVFVGGSVAGLLITDEAAADPRTTLDVDAVAEITSCAEYAAFGDRLRALGFLEDTREGAPLCRWVHHGTTLDVMPLDEKILGFFQQLVSGRNEVFGDAAAFGRPRDPNCHGSSFHRHENRGVPRPREGGLLWKSGFGGCDLRR